MTGPVVNEIRARGDAIRLGEPSGENVSFRVEIPEVWDLVRIDAPRSTIVGEVKQRALEALCPRAADSDGWVVKFRGFEVLNEGATLSGIGIGTGSTLLITGRHKRPVR